MFVKHIYTLFLVELKIFVYLLVNKGIKYGMERTPFNHWILGK